MLAGNMLAIVERLYIRQSDERLQVMAQQTLLCMHSVRACARMTTMTLDSSLPLNWHICSSALLEADVVK